MNRSFPRYPAYKDSGVEWLGEVPEHWEVGLLKRDFSVTLGKMLQTEPRSPSERLLPYLRASNIQPAGIDVSSVNQMWFSEQEEAQLKLQPGDLLVSEGGDVGRSALWSGEIEECFYQNSINRVRPRSGNNHYLFFLVIRN